MLGLDFSADPGIIQTWERSIKVDTIHCHWKSRLGWYLFYFCSVFRAIFHFTFSNFNDVPLFLFLFMPKRVFQRLYTSTRNLGYHFSYPWYILPVSISEQERDVLIQLAQRLTGMRHPFRKPGGTLIKWNVYTVWVCYYAAKLIFKQVTMIIAQWMVRVHNSPLNGDYWSVITWRIHGTGYLLFWGRCRNLPTCNLVGNCIPALSLHGHQPKTQ